MRMNVDDLTRSRRKQLGMRIKLRRIASEVDQKDLAAKIGMKAPQLSAIEKGRLAIRVDQLYQIADVLKCKPGELLDSEPPPH